MHSCSIPKSTYGVTLSFVIEPLANYISYLRIICLERLLVSSWIICSGSPLVSCRRPT